ncbi:MAG: sulfotransferase family protein, partial [Pirellulales bacterium]
MTTPNFFVVGMPRAGTTTLWTLLRAHPQVFMPEIKEPRHFDDDLPPDPYARFRRAPLPHSAVSVCRDRTAYLALFAQAENQRAVGEASLYIRSGVAAQRICDFNPQAKFILMLRDPVDALYSLYHLHLRNASIRCTFDEFFSEFSPWYQRLPDRVRQIQELFGHDRICIHLFEELSLDPARVYRSLLQFLEVSPDFSPEFKKYNSSSESTRPGVAAGILSVLHSPAVTQLRRR